MPSGVYKRKQFSEIHLKNMKLSHIGNLCSNETRHKISEKNKIRCNTKSYKDMVSKIHKGKIVSPETKLKLSISHKGKYLSDEIKKKISETCKRVCPRGDKNSSWRGGISFEPYSVDWTETLRRSIRERDHYTCQICGKEPATDVHHIDYNKKNCNPDNLITLCDGCHVKTNFNREYWIEYFKNKGGVLNG